MADPKHRDSGPLLTPEELSLLRSLFDEGAAAQGGGSPRIPLDPQALSLQGPLLRYLMELGPLTLAGEKGRCQLKFGARLEIDDAGIPALTLQPPSLLERHDRQTRKLRVHPGPQERLGLADLDGRLTLPRILNVSVTGLFIADAFIEAPQVGEIIDGLLLTLPNRDTLSLRAEIVRVDPLTQEGVSTLPPPRGKPDPTHTLGLRLLEEPEALEAYVFHRFWEDDGLDSGENPFLEPGDR